MTTPIIPNTTTTFAPDWEHRYANGSAQMQQRRNTTFDANMKIVNAEFRRLVQQRRAQG